MTIREAITKIDSLKYNTYSDAEKISWLSQLDWDIKRNIMDQHEGSHFHSFWGYNSETDQETPLLVTAPFDQIYLRWLEAQIDYYNGETDSYNAAIIQYNNLYEAYGAYYKRNHLPLNHGRFLF